MLQLSSERKTMTKTFSRNVSKSFLNSNWKQIAFLFIYELHLKDLLEKTRCVQMLPNFAYVRMNSVLGLTLKMVTVQWETFEGENFRGLLAFAAPKDATLTNFTEKTFANNHKTTKFPKVFTLKSFLLYGIYSQNSPIRFEIRVRGDSHFQPDIQKVR